VTTTAVAAVVTGC